jgi:hypothetical protein
MNAPMGIPGKMGVMNAKPTKPKRFLILMILLFFLLNTFFFAKRCLRSLYLCHHFSKAALKYVNKIFEVKPEIVVTKNTFKKLNLKSNMALGIPNFPKKKTQERNTVNILKNSFTLQVQI